MCERLLSIDRYRDNGWRLAISAYEAAGDAGIAGLIVSLVYQPLGLIVPVTIMISHATTRPFPSLRGSSRWLITETSDSDSRTRIISCSLGSHTAMMREMVWTAFFVCGVGRTR